VVDEPMVTSLLLWENPKPERINKKKIIHTKKHKYDLNLHNSVINFIIEKVAEVIT
jgi:hypothetical protein